MDDQSSKFIRCDIYAGGMRVRTFPDDRALQIVEVRKRGSALVLLCRDATNKLVEVETTLRYLLVKPAEERQQELQDSNAAQKTAFVQ